MVPCGKSNVARWEIPYEIPYKWWMFHGHIGLPSAKWGLNTKEEPIRFLGKPLDG